MDQFIMVHKSAKLNCTIQLLLNSVVSTMRSL